MNSTVVKDIKEAYSSVYYSEDNLFEDIVNYCQGVDIFETLEETEYFANLIIENELVNTFVEDVLEYYSEEQLLDESYIAEVSAGLLKTGMKLAGGLLKKVTPAVRGLPAKTLVKKGYTPGGFSATGKQLGKVNKPALATQTRSIQQARAARKPPEPQKANKYADMLAQKKASQAASPKPATTKTPKTGLSPEGRAIQKLNKMTGGGPLGSRELPKLSPRAPKPAWGAGATPPKPQQVPGQVQRSVALPSSKTTSSTKPSKKTPEPFTGGKPPRGGGLTNTVRAKLSPTEKTGNMKYPGLEKYATGSGPGTGGGKPPQKSKLGPITAASGAIAAGASVSEKPSEDKNKKPSGKVSNIKKPKKTVTGEDVRRSFDTAFATERKLKGSKGTFRWTNSLTGKSGSYTTKVRGESLDTFDFILDALLTEGYANSYEDALKIMADMNEEFVIEALRDLLNPNNSAAAKAQMQSPFAKSNKPLPSTPSPFAKPASRTDSGKLTTYGAGGGAEAERRGQTRAQVMQQGAKNLENKKRAQANPGPNFGR